MPTIFLCCILAIQKGITLFAARNGKMPEIKRVKINASMAITFLHGSNFLMRLQSAQAYGNNLIQNKNLNLNYSTVVLKAHSKVPQQQCHGGCSFFRFKYFHCTLAGPE
jgi:hypothetical protein